MRSHGEESTGRKRNSKDSVKQKSLPNGKSSRRKRPQPDAGGNGEWPQWIPLGTAKRPDDSPNFQPGEVRSAADLPRRISVGDLDEQSFKSIKDGWRSGGQSSWAPCSIAKFSVGGNRPSKT